MIRFGKWLSYFALGLSILFFVFALLLPTVFSGKLAIVQSSSMEPAIPAGALAIMMPVAPEKVKVGDIVTFNPPWDPDVTISHRVIEIQDDGELHFVTKGDATEEADPFAVSSEQIHGKVNFNIPYVGFAAVYVLQYVRTWLGFALLVAIPSAILIGSTIRGLGRSRSVRARGLKNQLKHRQRWQRATFY
jgi:signal peptidase